MVTFRIEAGCLGPQGTDKIDQFCDYAQEKIQEIEPSYMHWILLPRYDKAMPEIQYQINHRNITEEMANKYLETFGRCFDEFEDELHDLIAQLIDSYLGH